MNEWAGGVFLGLSPCRCSWRDVEEADLPLSAMDSRKKVPYGPRADAKKAIPAKIDARP